MVWDIRGDKGEGQSEEIALFRQSIFNWKGLENKIKKRKKEKKKKRKKEIFWKQ
jgi:hypothetical protein